MKKFLLVAVALVAGVVTAFAQPRAIGGRLGYGVEASYQHGLGDNMLSIDAGLFGFYGVEAVVTYDWIFPISSWEHKGEWNWYAGVGGGFGWQWWSNCLTPGVAGRIGVEYDFWFPLQLSLDWRPVFGPAIVPGGGAGYNFGGLYAGAICWGVRYKF